MSLVDPASPVDRTVDAAQLYKSGMKVAVVVSFIAYNILFCVGLYISRNSMFLYAQVGGGEDLSLPHFLYTWTKVAAVVLALLHIKILYQYLKNIPVVVFALLSFLASTIWSVDKYITLNNVLNCTLCLSTFILHIHYFGARSAIRVTWYVGAVVLLISAMLALSGSPYALTGAMKSGWRGLVMDKNTFGSMSALVLLLTLFAGAIKDLPVKLRALVVALCCVCLLGANSAGATLAVAFAIVFPLTRHFLANIKGRLMVFGAIIVCAAAILVYFNYELVLSLVGRDLTLSNRTIIWMRVLPFTFIHVFGYGYGTSGGSEIWFTLAAQSGGLYKAIDNAYIVLAIDMGWGFSLAYIGWLMSMLFKAASGAGAQIAGKNMMISLAIYTLAQGMVALLGGPYLSYHLLVLLLIYTVLAISRASEEAGLER